MAGGSLVAEGAALRALANWVETDGVGEAKAEMAGGGGSWHCVAAQTCPQGRLQPHGCGHGGHAPKWHLRTPPKTKCSPFCVACNFDWGNVLNSWDALKEAPHST